MKPKTSPLAISAISAFVFSMMNPADASAAGLMLSNSTNRSSAVTLNNRSVSGNIYIFATPDTGAKQVYFYLDDTRMSRTPMTIEGLAPFDLAGTATNGTAKPYDTSRLVAGNHTLTARYVFKNGTSTVVNATFSRTSTAAITATPTPTPAPTPTPTPISQPQGKKWHPGHYLNAYWGTSMSWSISRVKDNPNLKGVSVVHAWRDLEPSKGVYNFTAIENELALAKAANKQLMIQIVDRTFQVSRSNCVPDYVKNDPIYKGGQSILLNSSGGFLKCTSLRWVPTVQDRLIALYSALGKRFNNEPNFEAIFIQEDGVETAGSNMSLYTTRGYADQERRGMLALATAFPNTVVFKFLSWGPYIGELFAYANQLGIGVGGPDLLPHTPTWAYPYYPQYAGKIPLQISVQDPGVLKYIRAGGTVEKLYDFGVTDPNGLNVNYLIWDQPESTELSYTKEILPLINAHNGYINSACPLNTTCR